MANYSIVELWRMTNELISAVIIKGTMKSRYYMMQVVTIATDNLFAVLMPDHSPPHSPSSYTVLGIAAVVRIAFTAKQ